MNKALAKIDPTLLALMHGSFQKDDKLQPFAPAHACPAVHDVYNAFQPSMMVRAGFGVGINIHSACPKFAGPGPGMGDCRRSRHTRCLRRIEIELRARNDLDSVLAPIWL